MSKLAILAALAAAVALPALAQAPAGDAARGKAAFMKNMCWTCHGTAGYGSQYGVPIAPNPMPWEAFAHQVRDPRSSMPPYAVRYLGDQDLADIYAYVASVKGGKKASEIALLKD
jgi:mono/diheme cytochrome c family protein